MEKFRKGDFIRLKNLAKYPIDRIFGKEVNIFEILIIEDNYVEVRSCKSKILISDIEPIPINGKDDFQIYYSTYKMATYVNPCDQAPDTKIDKSYYYDAFKRINNYLGKNYQEIMKEQGFQYVHEIQHYLNDELDHQRLEINDDVW